MTETEISYFEKEYKTACEQISDINEHLPILRSLASSVSSVTEMGVRDGVSTRSFLCEDVKLRLYDIMKNDQVENLINIAKLENKDVEYIIADVLDIEIEETDFLFIDTWHSYEQLKQELLMHAPKVKKYIAFHDTQTYGTINEDLWGNRGGKGLLPAIIEYLIDNPEWKFKIHKTNNNGLTVIEKVYN